jgi:hypothetical protein
MEIGAVAMEDSDGINRDRRTVTMLHHHHHHRRFETPIEQHNIMDRPPTPPSTIEYHVIFILVAFHIILTSSYLTAAGVTADMVWFLQQLRLYGIYVMPYTM